MTFVADYARADMVFQTPLKELVVIHPDPQYHADIKALESYIVEVCLFCKQMAMTCWLVKLTDQNFLFSHVGIERS